MKIFISKAYQKWLKTNRDPMAQNAIEGFLFRVFHADDITNIPQRPKAVGKDMSNPPAVVDEFSLGRRSRVYSKCLRTPTGEYSFYLASAGSKSVKKQREDIITALNIFNNFADEEWTTWEPGAEQMAILCVSETNNVDVASIDVVTDPAPTPVTKTKKKNVSPVDESGLTPAERKARRKAEQEEKRKQAQAAAKQRREQARQLAEQSHSTAPVATPAAEIPVADKTDTVLTPIAENVASVPVPDVKDNADDTVVAKPESATAPTAEPNDVPDAERVATPDNAESVAEPAPKPTAQPIVILNGAPVPTPQQVVGNVEFHDVADVQYKLELIERKMKIERLHIEIARQKIAIAEREIALEKLAMEKLQLKMSQAQQTQDVQK